MSVYTTGNKRDIAYIQGNKIRCAYKAGQRFYKALLPPLQNMIVNGSFEADTAGWASPQTLTREPIPNPRHNEYGLYSANITGIPAGDVSAQLSSALAIAAGRKYYIRGRVRCGTSGLSNVCQYMNDLAVLSGIPSTGVMGANIWVLYDGIWTASSTALLLRLSFTGGSSNQTRAVQFDNVMVVDLTAAYGADSEPSLSQIRNRIIDGDGYFYALSA